MVRVRVRRAYFLLCHAVYLLLKLPYEHFSGSKFLAVALVALSAFGCLRTSFESSLYTGRRVLVSYDVYRGTTEPTVLIRDEFMQDLLPDEVWQVLTPSLAWLGPHDRVIGSTTSCEVEWRSGGFKNWLAGIMDMRARQR